MPEFRLEEFKRLILVVGVAFALALALVSFGLVLSLTGYAIARVAGTSYSPTDIRLACLSHEGVAQVQSMAWDWRIHSHALVVCRDGSIKNVGH